MTPAKPPQWICFTKNFGPSPPNASLEWISASDDTRRLSSKLNGWILGNDDEIGDRGPWLFVFSLVSSLINLEIDDVALVGPVQENFDDRAKRSEG